MSLHLRALAAAIVCFILSPALTVRAQCSAPVSISVTTSGTFTTSCAIDPLTSRWNIDVTLSGAVSANPTVTIRGANTLMLGRVTVQNNSALHCRVNILGSGFDQRLGGLGYFDKGTSPVNRVLLLQLNTAGDVGYDRPSTAAIVADSISGLSIAGSVLGDLVSVAPSRSMGNVYINGDLAGGVSLGTTSSLDLLWVGGALGRPGDPPVTLNIPGNIGSITAGSINADISTMANPPAGTVHHIETTTGPFKGSLTCRRLSNVPAAPNQPRIVVAGDLDASITLTQDIRANIAIAGDFRAARNVNGMIVPNFISAPLAAFDTTTDPASFFYVGGAFSGAMSLGSPVEVTLGSLNRNLVVAGPFNGTLTTTADLNANVSVAGPLTGTILADGALRAGKSIASTGAFTGLISLGTSLAGTLSVPAGGMQGQVIVNSRNVGGTWSGSVMVGGAGLLTGAPYYTPASLGFGGGAVGLAPFRAHFADCTPAHNDPGPSGFARMSDFATAGGPGATKPVTIRLYGPVQPAPGVPMQSALEVEQLVAGIWQTRSSLFAIELLPAGAASSRSITLGGTGTTPPSGQYRARPTGLVCAAVTGAPAASWTDPYLFRIDEDCDANNQPDSAQIAANPSLDGNGNGQLDSCEGTSTPVCPCDHNHSNLVTVQDLFDFLRDYFSLNLAADYDGSGIVTLQDLFDFINCFFNPPLDC